MLKVTNIQKSFNGHHVLEGIDFEINKGVGREVEFKGLRAQYLFIFAAGLLAVFVMFVIMYMAGVGQ